MAKPQLIYLPRIQCFDNTGIPLNGGKLFIYQPGTMTKINTYPSAQAAANQSSPNPNPIILDVAGRPSNNGAPIDMYVNSAYKMVCSPSTDTDPPMSPIWTEDNITSLGQIVSVVTFTASYQVQQSDRDKLLVFDCSAAPLTCTLPDAGLSGNGFNVKIKKIDNSGNSLTIQAYGSQTIDGSNSLSTTLQYDYAGLYTDGTQWFRTKPASSPVLFTNQQVFNTSGTFTTPVGITTIFIEAFGDGGGGGSSNLSIIDGGAGGGGAYVNAFLPVVPGTSTAVTIGTGGAGATLNTTNSGSNGVGTSFGNLLVAAAGSGGTGINQGSGANITATVSGGGSGATISLTESGGVLTGGSVTSGGSGYINPVIVITDVNGINGKLTPTVSGGVITGFTINSAGVNYTSGLTGTVLDNSNKITALTVGSGGTGYTNPTLTISAPQSPSGTQATGTLTVVSGVITAATISFAGGGYSSATVSVSSQIAPGGLGGQPGACTVPTGGLVLAGNNGGTTTGNIVHSLGGAVPRMGIQPPGGNVGGSAPPSTGAGGNGGSTTFNGGAGATGLMIIRY